MSRIVNDLLNVARADSGRMVLTKSPTDLAQLIHEVVNEQRPTIKSRRQHISVTGKPVEAQVDSDRLRMALGNLISNASKYTPNGGTLSVTLAKTKAHTTIEIKDTGVGIAQADLPLMFTKFTRLNNPLSIERGGTGLGLYLVKKIIDLHHGEITVSSRPGKGSCFTILL